MKSWKVCKRTFDGNITKKLIEFFDLETMPNRADILYYCYKRKLFFFWVLKCIKTENEWNQTTKFITNVGLKVNDLYKCINF